MEEQEHNKEPTYELCPRVQPFLVIQTTDATTLLTPESDTEELERSIVSDTSWLDIFSDEDSFAVHSDHKADPESVCEVFVNTLLEQSGARQWGGYALATHPKHLLPTWLDEIMNKFIAKSLQDTDPQLRGGAFWTLKEAADIIRHKRSRITRYFCKNLESSSATSSPFTEQIKDVGQQLPRDRVATNLGSFHNMLVSNDVFNQMALEIKRRFYRDDVSQMISVRSVVRRVVSDYHTGHFSQYDAQLDVHWDVIQCMRARYGDRTPSIGSVIVLTGSSLYAQATTCEKYISQTWPKTGKILIEALDRFLKEKSTVDIEIGDKALNLIEKSPGQLRFSTRGGTAFSVDIAQQLGWLGSALGISPFGDQVAYAKPKVTINPIREFPDIVIQFEHSIIHATENACWLPLFPGAVIAAGFPIPNRANETGLEIALELLAGISGVHHAVEIQGGVVMKGFSHIFIPIRKRGDRIQWHAIFSTDPNTPITYHEGLSQCGSRALLEEVSLDDLKTCRSIVGWCSVAQSRLGSDLTNYENIYYSAATDKTTSTKCSKASLGFQQFGMAALDFEFGVTEGKCHFKRDGPYRNIVTWAERTPIVLYDTADRRGWLVPASEVLLHIIQCKHRQGFFEVDGKRIALDTNIAVDSTAKDVLLKNRSIKLSDEEKHTFESEIASIWSLLEFLIAENVADEQRSSGHDFKPPWGDILQGFEFNAVVEQHSPFRKKEAKLFDTNGGWPRLSRDIDALVLLANGFEEIIVPAVERSNDRLCRIWQHAPKGKDFLAAGTPILQRLYETAGCPLDRKYLTTSGSKLQWHQGTSMLFDPCAEPTRAQCSCNRLQQILTRSAMTRTIPPEHFKDQGAVIFGHDGSFLADRLRKPRAPAAKISGIYSLENVPLPPIVTQRDSDDASSSDGEMSEDNGSTTRTDHTPCSLSSGTTVSTQDMTLTPLTSSSRKRQRLPEPCDFNTSDGHEGHDDNEEVGLDIEHKRFKNADPQHKLESRCVTLGHSSSKRVRNKHQDDPGTEERVMSSAGTPDSLLDCYADKVSALMKLVPGRDDVCGAAGSPRTTRLSVRLMDQMSEHSLRRKNGFYQEASS
ncbi:hypothetical protein PSPO01_09690 [Paraphaeosphaeria sporulosa]